MPPATRRKSVNKTIPLSPYSISNSITVLETCLRSSISAILYARNALPAKAFAREKIVPDDPDSGEATELIMVQPGRSMRADHLLEWLNKSAFGALRTGSLSAIQLCIHPDANKRSNTLESYTFTIRYAPGADGRASLSSASVEDFDDEREAQFINDAEENLFQVVEDITSLCEGLPELPQERFLSMNLFLNPTANDGPMIKGFILGRRECAVFPQDPEWERRTESFESMSTNLHSTRLRIKYMAPLSTAQKSGRPLHMDVLTEFNRKVLMKEDLDWSMLRKRQDQQTTRTSARKTAGSRRSTLSNDETLKQSHAQASSLRDSGAHETETQSAAASMKEALNRMAQPDDFTQGDTQAASMSLAQPTQPVILGNIQLEYNPAMTTYNRVAPDVLQKQAASLALEIGGTTRSGQVILCQCCYSKEEGDMLRCVHCHTWQHAHCYGYVGKDDPRRPKDHICYVCLISPKEHRMLDGLIKVCLARRAAFQACSHGILSKGNFAERLGMNGGIAFPLFSTLVGDGAVVSASGSHKAGFKTSGKPSWVPASGAAFGKMLDMYFRPTNAVEKYFMPYSIDPSAIADKLTIKTEGELPPAAVSIAEKRKRQPMTPNSNIDSPREDDESEMTLDTVRVTRSTRARYQDEEFEDKESDEDEPPIRRGRSNRKKTKPDAVEEFQVHTLESERIIDVGINAPAPITEQ